MINKKKPSKGIFDKIPEEVSNKMAEFLDTKSLSKLHLRIYSKGVRGLFAKPCAIRLFEKLLQDIVDGNLKDVDKILTSMPHLLHPQEKYLTDFMKNLVITSTLNSLKIKAEVPLKLALKLNQLKTMEVILPHFKKLPDGQTICSKQWESCEIGKIEKLKIKTIYEQEFIKLIHVIKNETFTHGSEDDELINRISSHTKKTLEGFKNKLLPNKPIELDDHYDFELFLSISHDLYDQNFDELNNDRRDLLCLFISILQKCQSWEIAQQFCHGLDKNTKISNTAQSLQIKVNDGKYVSYYDFNRYFFITSKGTLYNFGGWRNDWQKCLKTFYQSREEKFCEIKNKYITTAILEINDDDIEYTTNH
jgi:hypothetical protein